MIDYIENLKLQNSLENKKIIELVKKYIEYLNTENAYLNEKFYKNGFKDGLNLIMECIY